MAKMSGINYRTLKVKNQLIKLDPDIYVKIVNTNPEFPNKKFNMHINIDKLGYVYIFTSSKPLKRQSLSHFVLNAQPGQVVDHINRCKLDNRRCNLRVTDFRQNSLNTKCRNSTGFYGVSDKKVRTNHKYLKNNYKYYNAEFMQRNGKRLTFRAPFTDEGLILAAMARDRFVLQNGEENYARLNFEHFKFKTFKYLLLNADLEKIKEQLYNDDKILQPNIVLRNNISRPVQQSPKR
ncbi:MAG: hypothetical protein NTW93_00670 [Phycisphaerae bacterium]|nr:hypothetical protein [Phycisphaerae bacterium]